MTDPAAPTPETLPEMLVRLARAIHAATHWTERNQPHQRHTAAFETCAHADCAAARAALEKASGS